MCKKNRHSANSVIPHGEWSGNFNYPDTKGLLNLNDRLFSIKRFKEKRWCYMGIIHPDIIFGCAVVHFGYISSAFAFGFDPADGPIELIDIEALDFVSISNFDRSR